MKPVNGFADLYLNLTEVYEMRCVSKTKQHESSETISFSYLIMKQNHGFSNLQ